MIAFPNAKINIGLNVTHRRTDGYHELETIFYPVKIYDALEVIPASEMKFEVSGLSIPGRPEDNLCLKGYYLLKKDFDLPPVSIHLHKHIPIGAGLGGGSSDAAFFIKLLNREFALNLNADQMRDYVRQLGADCAFFIDSSPVYAFGKGDEFGHVNLDLSRYHITVVMPTAHVSTAEAYRGVRPKPAAYSLKEMINRPVNDWRHSIKNDFEDNIFNNHPSIRGVKAALYQAGALYASMSGSGASVFGIFDSAPNLSLIGQGYQIYDML